jgi:hypothetical protein
MWTTSTVADETIERSTNMKRTLVMAVFAVVVVAGSTAVTAQNMVRVRITNVSKQVISPPLVVTHSWKARVFIPGKPASDELSLLAEDGDPSELAALLSANDEVLDVAVAENPLPPGETAVFELRRRGRFNRLSAVGMLVTTNDAFFGVENFLIDLDPRNQRVFAPAWDAGTEFNNELCAFIPGPPCENPMIRDTVDAEGFVHTHPGISGRGDLSPADWNWQGPVVDILVIKK